MPLIRLSNVSSGGTGRDFSNSLSSSQIDWEGYARCARDELCESGSFKAGRLQFSTTAYSLFLPVHLNFY